MLLFLFIKLRILFRFLFLHTSKDQLVTVVAVIQRTVYAADGGGGSSGLLGNLQICLAVLQHGSHFEPLGQRQQFVDSTQIFEETVAFLTGLQTQHRIKRESTASVLIFYSLATHLSIVVINTTQLLVF